MSLLPYVINDFHLLTSPRIKKQHFGVAPQGFITIVRCPSYYRSTSVPEADAQCGDSDDNDKFKVNLDVHHFAPDEIHVKVTDNKTVTVEGSHEEKPDEHGFISRQFVRKYVVPDGYDVQKVESNLSSDGVLSITAPKIKMEVGDRTIPIQRTGVPSRTMEKKNDS